MNNCKRHLLLSVFLLLLVMIFAADLPLTWAGVPTTPKANAIMRQAKARIMGALTKNDFQLGQPVFMRIFKMEGELEVWIRKNGSYALFKTYPICSYSGYPGPKLYEGDWQSPEGFYRVSASQMNPNSRYHLSFNVGYPNAFDKARKRTGSCIMVHGGCSSRGCFAMGNEQMEEIYLLAHSALSHGQKNFSLHIFPFRMTAHNMAQFKSSPWFGFWKNLQQGYSAFEISHQVPLITADNGKYIVSDHLQLAMSDKDGRQHNTVQ